MSVLLLFRCSHSDNDGENIRFRYTVELLMALRDMGHAFGFSTAVRLSAANTYIRVSVVVTSHRTDTILPRSSHSGPRHCSGLTLQFPSGASSCVGGRSRPRPRIYLMQVLGTIMLPDLIDRTIAAAQYLGFFHLYFSSWGEEVCNRTRCGLNSVSSWLVCALPLSERESRVPRW